MAKMNKAAQGFGKGIFYAHSSVKSTSQGHMIEPNDGRPFNQVLRDTPKCYPFVGSDVEHLLLLRSPSAIGFTVALAVVDALNGEALLVGRPHIFNELANILPPTNICYPSCAVVLELWMGWIVASLFHVVMNTCQRVPFPSYAKSMRGESFSAIVRQSFDPLLGMIGFIHASFMGRGYSS